VLFRSPAAYPASISAGNWEQTHLSLIPGADSHTAQLRRARQQRSVPGAGDRRYGSAGGSYCMIETSKRHNRFDSVRL
jgi:hypothetical protein